jgi:hypothetical protein
MRRSIACAIIETREVPITRLNAIPDSHAKEQISLAFLQALAAQAGLNVRRWEWDDGIDLEVGSNKPMHGDYVFSSFHIGLQVKATQNWSVQNGKIAYPLKSTNYQRLRTPNKFSPEYLILHTLPIARDRWLCHQADHTDILHHAYFMDLSGLPALSPNANGEIQGTRTVHVPVANVLTGAKLFQLFESACKEVLSVRRPTHG